MTEPKDMTAEELENIVWPAIDVMSEEEIHEVCARLREAEAARKEIATWRKNSSARKYIERAMDAARNNPK